MNWSKSFEMYLKLSDKQRLSIGKKCHEILYPEIEKLSEEEALRPVLYLLSAAPFMSLSEAHGKDEYNFFKNVTGYADSYEVFVDTATKGKNEKVAKFLEVYFQKLGGEILTAYLSLALALLTIKGEVTEEDKKLLESIQA